MKKVYLFLLLISSLAMKAQSVLFLQPDGSQGQDALITSYQPSSNFGSHPEIDAMAWTNGGTPLTFRSLFRFDMSSIPSGSTIISATLNLYNSPGGGNNSGQHSSLSGSNEAVISRVTSPWDEYTVTWDNQPTVTSDQAAIVQQSNNVYQDYSFDVTGMVADMRGPGNSNYGFMIQLVTEDYYRCLIFGSSDNTDPNNRPSLIIEYNPPIGVEEVEKKVVMNYFDSHLSLTHIQDTELMIYDLSGRMVKNLFLSGKGRANVNLEELTAGLYTAVSLSGENRAVQRFIQ